MAHRAIGSRSASLSIHSQKHVCLHCFPTSSSSHSSISEAPSLSQIKGLAPHIQLNDALQLFDKMHERKTPNLTSFYLSVLSAIVRAKRYTVAIDIYRRLASDGVMGNISLLNILLNCYCALYCTGCGFGVLGHVLKRGFDLKRVCFTSLVSGLCIQNRIGEAMSLFCRLKELKFCPDVNMYRAVVKGLCGMGGSEVAVSLNERMTTAEDNFWAGFHRDLICYNIIIDGLFRDGMIDKARELFSEMNRKRISPDVVTYGSMIHGLINAAKWEEASCLFYEMKTHGVFPDVVTYNSVIHGLC